MRFLAIFLLSFTLLGCESTYYSLLERVGIHKRDILSNRVEAVSKVQLEAKEEFETALEALQELTRSNDSDLHSAYKKIEKKYKSSEKMANKITELVDGIEEFSDDLFNEWDDELDLYSNSGLRRESEKKFKQAKLSYQQMISAIAKAEKRMIPVLEALRDNMLYLRHNLNTSALDILRIEFGDLKIDIERAIRDIGTAIEESNNFIDSLNQREARA